MSSIQDRQDTPSHHRAPYLHDQQDRSARQADAPPVDQHWAVHAGISAREEAVYRWFYEANTPDEEEAAQREVDEADARIAELIRCTVSSTSQAIADGPIDRQDCPETTVNCQTRANDSQQIILQRNAQQVAQQAAQRDAYDAALADRHSAENYFLYFAKTCSEIRLARRKLDEADARVKELDPTGYWL